MRRANRQYPQERFADPTDAEMREYRNKTEALRQKAEQLKQIPAVQDYLKAQEEAARRAAEAQAQARAQAQAEAQAQAAQNRAFYQGAAPPAQVPREKYPAGMFNQPPPPTQVPREKYPVGVFNQPPPAQQRPQIPPSQSSQSQSPLDWNTNPMAPSQPKPPPPSNWQPQQNAQPRPMIWQQEPIKPKSFPVVQPTRPGVLSKVGSFFGFGRK